MTIAFVYKWTHLPTLKWYIGSRTKKGCHPEDGYITSSKKLLRLMTDRSEWERTIIATGEPAEMYQLETEILQLFDARNDPRSINGHNNEGLIRGMPGEKNSMYGAKRPDLSARNSASKGKPNYAARQPRPLVRGNLNAMARPEVQEHHRNTIVAALARPEVKEKHRAANKIAQNRPEVIEAKSKRMKEYCARSEVKAEKSIRISGDNNPSILYRMTCVGCGKTMSKGMFNRWGHGDKCQK